MALGEKSKGCFLARAQITFGHNGKLQQVSNFSDVPIILKVFSLSKVLKHFQPPKKVVTLRKKRIFLMELKVNFGHN